MPEALQKLSTVLACEERRKSKWRRLSFTDICHSIGEHSSKMETAVVDALFNIEFGIKASKTFINFGEASSTI